MASAVFAWAAGNWFVFPCSGAGQWVLICLNLFWLIISEQFSRPVYSSNSLCGTVWSDTRWNQTLSVSHKRFCLFLPLCLSLSLSVSLFLPLSLSFSLYFTYSVSLFLLLSRSLCLSQMMPISPSVCISFSLFFCNCLSLSPPVCHSLSLSLNFLFSPSALLSVCLSDCPSPFPWGVYLCSYSVISTQCDRADLSACWLKKDVFVFTFKGLLP